MLTLPDHGPVYLVIDALDECLPTTDSSAPREQLLYLIMDIVKLRLPGLHLCVTSRPERDIRASLEPLASHLVSLQDESGQAKVIDEYIRSFVQSSKHLKRWRAEERELVIEKLSHKAGGM